MRIEAASVVPACEPHLKTKKIALALHSFNARKPYISYKDDVATANCAGTNVLRQLQELFSLPRCCSDCI